MDEHFDLFTPRPAAPKRVNRGTSIVAHDALREIGEMHLQIVDVLRKKGAMTFYEVADQLNVESKKVQPRMSELANEFKLIEDSGERHMSPYGRKGIAWKAIK